jgi:predicted anti-sigma-YlaC factor YlaD
MDCHAYRDAISAELDGEEPGLTVEELSHHLSTCTSCTAFADGARTLHRVTRLREAEPVPDLVGAVLARVETPQRHRPEWARYALFAVAFSQLLLAIPLMLFGNYLDATVHVARELGSWDVALAVGLLYAAWRPDRASGLLPFAAALAGAMAFTAALDVAAGRETALSEAHHVLELVGLALLVVLARPTWRRPDRSDRSLAPTG